MNTNGDFFRTVADQRGIPLRTLENVKVALAEAKKQKGDVAMARLMLRHGRLTDLARAYVASYRSKWGAGQMTTKEKLDMSKTKERAVLVTTVHRGVFFGYATDTNGATISLRAARNCLYWPAENKGFLGLASTGPLMGARVGPAADIELRDITCVAECTPAAVEAWEKSPWAR